MNIEKGMTCRGVVEKVVRHPDHGAIPGRQEGRMMRGRTALAHPIQPLEHLLVLIEDGGPRVKVDVHARGLRVSEYDRVEIECVDDNKFRTSPRCWPWQVEPLEGRAGHGCFRKHPEALLWALAQSEDPKLDKFYVHWRGASDDRPPPYAAHEFFAYAGKIWSPHGHWSREAALQIHDPLGIEVKRW